MKKLWLYVFVLFLIAGLASFTGCDDGSSSTSADLPEGADEPEVIDDGTEAASPYVLFAPNAPIGSVATFPSDILMGKASGLVEMPLADPANPPTPLEEAVVINGLNNLDGFGINASAIFELSEAVDPATVAGNVKVVEVTKTVNGDGSISMAVVGELAEGVDFSVHVELERFIFVTPLKPFKPRTTYAIAIGEGLANLEGELFVRSDEYEAIAGGDAAKSDATATDLEHLVIAELGAMSGVVPLVTTSFTTQSIGESLKSLAANINIGDPPDTAELGAFSLAGPGNLLPPATPGPGLYDFGGGAFELWQGTLIKKTYIPYRNFPDGSLHGKWVDAEGHAVTDGIPENPVSEEIPVLLARPPTGVAVVGVIIFQHGITGNRTNILPTFASAYAPAGIAVIGIDLLHHGLLDCDPAVCGTEPVPIDQPSFMAYLAYHLCVINCSVDDAAIERLIPGTNSGDLQLTAVDPITIKDNLRQAAYDILALASAIPPAVDLNADGFTDFIDVPYLAEYNRHLVGHSLGAMVAVPTLAAAGSDTFITTSLLVPGSRTVEGALRKSAFFGPTIQGIVQDSIGVAPGTRDELFYVSAYQMGIDGGDPGSYAAQAAATGVPIALLKQLNDVVIPNETTDYLIDALGLDIVSAIPPAYLGDPFVHASYMADWDMPDIDLPGGGHPEIILNPTALEYMGNFIGNGGTLLGPIP